MKKEVNPDIDNIPMGEKMGDFEEWYREKNTR